MNKISQKDKLTLLGLKTLSNRYHEHLRMLIKMGNEIVGEKGTRDDNDTVIAEWIWGENFTVDEMLETVKKRENFRS